MRSWNNDNLYYIVIKHKTIGCINLEGKKKKKCTKCVSSIGLRSLRENIHSMSWLLLSACDKLLHEIDELGKN